jgi:hypothetical protein
LSLGLNMPKKITLIIMIAAVILLSCRQCYSIGTARLSESEIDAKLQALKPLPKVHYSYSSASGLLNDRNSRRLYELARITHSLGMKGEWATQQQIDNCVYTCARINKTKPVIETSLGITFSPWHRRFGKDLPPTDRGPTYYEEIRYFEIRARLVEQWVKQSNEKYKSNVQVSAVLLETERFNEKAGDSVWNEGIRDALDAIHIKAKTIFPKARIEWYYHGIGQSASKEGWSKTSTWTGKEITESLSCSLYSVWEIERTRETFRRTAKLADELKVEDVTPWVALASGYRRGLNDLSNQRFHLDWDYDITYSYLLGREINISWYGDRPECFAPYNRAKVVVFYPPAFDEHVPNWGKHFIAYVRGATGVSDLHDLGYEE